MGRWGVSFAASALAYAACGGAAAATQTQGPTPQAQLTLAVVRSLPPYRPEEQVSGVIRLWGHGSPKHDFLGPLVRHWIALFHRYQPAVTIDDQMHGTASAIGALYTGAGNLAILGEEISPAAAAAFRRERHYPPTRIEIATGSLDVNYFDYAHMVFVNAANPLERLTLAQLDAIFGSEHRRAARNVRIWGELGLRGAWSQRRIQPYFWRVDQDFGLYFRARVLDGSHRWNPDIAEFDTIERPGGGFYDRGQQILDALARDRYGIAVSNVRFANAQVRAVELAVNGAGPYTAATPAALIAQRYPLTRVIPAFIDRPPGEPIEPAVREFLRFVLSREGQQALLQDSGYLPLGPDAVREQLAMLGGGSRTTRRSRPLTSRAAPGVIRVWGNPRIGVLARRWASAFRASHPQVRIELHMTGSDTAMAGLYTGQADIALLGRTATASETKAFEWVFRHPPTRVQILRGSLDRQGKSPALVAFVQRENPLAQINIAQLAGLLLHRPVAGAYPIRTWGQLGLRGKWSRRPVDLYIPDTESGTGRFLREAVLGGSALLEWRRVTEFSVEDENGSSREARTRILSALAHDRYGLALASLPHGDWPVKPLRLAARAGGPYYAPTRASIVDGRYALGRAVYAYFNSAEQDLEPAVREFVQYIDSPDGQALVQPGDGYLALTGAAARAALPVRTLPQKKR
jgi:phosphate transport system substrate-binding protein